MKIASKSIPNSYFKQFLWKKISQLFISTSVPNSKYVDVIISGGGMVGTALACALGKKEFFWLNNFNFNKSKPTQEINSSYHILSDLS